MNNEYVQQQDGVHRITGSRVSLDSIVYAFWNGESAETIAQSFPVLTLEQVYDTIVFYLANRAEIDRHLEQQRVDYEAKRQAAATPTQCSTKSWLKRAANSPPMPMLLPRYESPFSSRRHLHQLIITTVVAQFNQGNLF